MIRRPARPDDQFVVTSCTTTDWTISRDAFTVTAEKVKRLGCGCTEIWTTRPGPPDGPLAGPMTLLVDRCRFHRINYAGHGPEPVRLEAPDEVALREQLAALSDAVDKHERSTR